MEHNLEHARLERELETLRHGRAALRALLLTDVETGLLKADYLEQRVAEEIQRARRTNASFCVLAIDLLGGGETARAGASRLIVELIRRHDVCCRGRSEDFLLLLPSVSLSSSAPLVERLHRRLRRDIGPIAIGMAGWTNAIADEAHELIASARLSLRHQRGDFAAEDEEAVTPTDRVRPSKVWLERAPLRLSFVGVKTARGVCLRAKLPFLRLGSLVRYNDGEHVQCGTLARAVLGSRQTTVPVLQIDLTESATDR